MGVAEAELEEDEGGEEDVGLLGGGEGGFVGVEVVEEGLGGLLGFAPVGLVGLDGGWGGESVGGGVEKEEVAVGLETEVEEVGGGEHGVGLGGRGEG